jgi:chromosome segregation ATPase
MQRKDLRVEALIGQIEGLDCRVAALRIDVRNERERTQQVQMDLERETERLQREKQVRPSLKASSMPCLLTADDAQLEISRREDQISRLLNTLERMREKEAVLIEELRTATSRKGAYKEERNALKQMINEMHVHARELKKHSDNSTAFTIIK